MSVWCLKAVALLFLFDFFSLQNYAQVTFPKDEPKYNQPGIYALTHATIHVNSLMIIDDATLLVEKDKILEVGKNINIPKNAVVIDLKGKHIYPSFIDLYSSYGMPEIKRGAPNQVQYETVIKGAVAWNESIHPETNAYENFKSDVNVSKELRAIGFGLVMTHSGEGIMRGTGAIVSLNDDRENNTIIKNESAMFYSFRKGNSNQAYPSSLMGCIALMRQTLYDAQWYKEGGYKKEYNPALEAITVKNYLPIIFDAADKYNVLRAQKVGAEFNLNFIYKAGGNEYQRIDEMAGVNSAFILPVNFPEAFDVEDFYESENISMAELRHWELAPGNLTAFYRKKIPFCITTDGLKERNTFFAQLKKALAFGIPEAEILKALTEVPATLLGIRDKAGTLDKNKLANFIVTDKPLFADKCVIFQNWIAGRNNEIKDIDAVDIRGEYNLNINQTVYSLSVKGESNAPSAEVRLDTIKSAGTVKKDVSTISVSFIARDKTNSGVIRLSGTVNFDSGSWDGTGHLPDGKKIAWTAVRKDKFKEKENTKTSAVDSSNIGKVCFPNMAYGFDTLPEVKTFLIRNATVWTNENDGILKETDVLIREGKIRTIGKNLSKPSGKVIVIDGTGKHVTSGIIDEHSHIAISAGVNEAGQTVSAEVSIGDVVNSDDINIYRQLAGGVTAAQLLHGSANPIGGQSAIIKLRWGSSPDQMKIINAPGFIKCALGENVKQSNWGENFNVRYPQSRMGVEQIFYDAFHKALAYDNEWKEYYLQLPKAKVKPEMPRRDIENDVLLEILKGKRFITCHSYVQSEINMLMHVADSMRFKINTFTHILEGYKVADKMAKHGASGSTFSDWWSYKFEVYDAIPYNAALMTMSGVNVSMNSDDAEMARRLNQEAAKAVKYGNVSEEEAWKMVTLNPAKMLHLDKQTGSLKDGKDADVVIWSDNPLSIYAKVEKTFVDGRLLFDRATEDDRRTKDNAERLRIIKKMMEAKASGERTVKPLRKTNKQYHCDTIGEEAEEDYNE